MAYQGARPSGLRPLEAVALRSPDPPEESRPPQPVLSQSSSPPPLEVATSPELLQDLGQLREWYEEASHLERQIAQLSAKANHNEHQLAATRRRAAEVRTQKEQAAKSIPQLSRTRKEAEKRSLAMAASLKAEQENVAKRTKDNKGLRRSLQKLLKRLGHVTLHTEDIEKVICKEEEFEEVAHIEEETLKETMKGMSDMQERLTKQIREERQKRLQLRDAARAKLERVEQSQAGLKKQLDDHNDVLSAMKGRLAAQEERTHAAQQALALSREAYRRAGQFVEEQQETRRAMHAELMNVQRAHENLRADLEVTLLKLDEISLRESKAQEKWRVQHMERLDARIRANQELDQDVVVAEDPFLHARAGGC